MVDHRVVDAGRPHQAINSSAPSRWIESWVSQLALEAPPRRALDVAMGSGRHALVLAAAGYATFGVDRRLPAVQQAALTAAASGHRLRAWCADLTRTPLPRAHFQVIVVTRYLQRDLFTALAAALAPGGVLLYETFTERQRALGWGPTSPDHLLKPGELQTLAAPLTTRFYEEVEAPEAIARLVARRD
jgi:tellurite methyltransferase